YAGDDDIHDESSGSGCANWTQARDRSLKHQWSSTGVRTRARRLGKATATTPVNGYPFVLRQRGLLAGQLFLRPLNTRLKLGLLDPAVLVRVDQPTDAEFQPPNRFSHARAIDVLALRRVQPPIELALETLGIVPQGAEIRPHGLLDAARQALVGTRCLAAVAIPVGPETAIIAVLTAGEAMPPAAVGRTATLTDQETTEQEL